MQSMITLVYFSFSDGLLEVVGLYSSLHIAKVRVNLVEPIMLGQARNVKVGQSHIHFLDFSNFNRFNLVLEFHVGTSNLSTS